MLHHLNEPGSTVVTDSQATLDIGNGGLAIVSNQGHSLIVFFIIFGVVKHFLLAVVVALDHLFVIIRLTLIFKKRSNPGNLFFGNKGALDTHELSCARWAEQHVSVAKQAFWSPLVNDDPAVNF